MRKSTTIVFCCGVMLAMGGCASVGASLGSGVAAFNAARTAPVVVEAPAPRVVYVRRHWWSRRHAVIVHRQ